jgi:hypothetical protein
MGMYDIIRTNHPLVRPGEYQTKDLECGLDEYKFREDGSLVCTYRFGADEHTVRPITLTGEVCFYTDFRDGTGWHEYSAYFSRGKLIHLEQLSPPNRELTGGEALRSDELLGGPNLNPEK